MLERYYKVIRDQLAQGIVEPLTEKSEEIQEFNVKAEPLPPPTHTHDHNHNHNHHTSWAKSNGYRPNFPICWHARLSNWTKRCQNILPRFVRSTVRNTSLTSYESCWLHWTDTWRTMRARCLLQRTENVKHQKSSWLESIFSEIGRLRKGPEETFLILL